MVLWSVKPIMTHKEIEKTVRAPGPQDAKWTTEGAVFCVVTIVRVTGGSTNQVFVKVLDFWHACTRVFVKVKFKKKM